MIVVGEFVYDLAFRRNNQITIWCTESLVTLLKQKVCSGKKLKTEAKADWKWKMFNGKVNSIWSLIMI